MKKFKIIKDDGNTFMFIVYPFNDKNTTFGFNVKKSDLYQLYLDLKNVIEENKNDEEE